MTIIDLTTPPTVINLLTPASSSDAGTGSSLGTIDSSDALIGRHYNPTSTWMIWTNRAYEPNSFTGRYRQNRRLARWLDEGRDPFGYHQ